MIFFLINWKKDHVQLMVNYYYKLLVTIRVIKSIGPLILNVH